MRKMLRWRLAFASVTAVVMMLALAAPAVAAVTDVFYGIRDNGVIDQFDPVTGATTPLIDVVPPVLDTSTSGPNGLAYDEVTHRLYYTEYPDANGDGRANLYFTDLDDAVPTVTPVGSVAGLVSDADIYEGDYYYIHHGTDDLYKVDLAEDGTIVGTPVKWDISGNTHRWTFDGDIAIWEGVIYGWGACTHGYEFFSVNIDGTGFKVIAKPLASVAALQLAFASDGTLYGHNYGSGRTYRVTWTENSVTATFVRVATNRYTDTASGSTGTDIGYSITGSKWYDRNKNAVRDSEPPVAGWKISLWTLAENPASGLLEPVWAKDTTTAPDGSYSFDGLEAGAYRVTEGTATGCWKQTFPATGYHDVCITDAGVEDLDFGNVCEATQSGGYTLGFWSNKNGQATLAAYNIEAGDVDAWQSFLDTFNLVDKAGEAYDPSIEGAFRAWLLKADATNMSYMLSVQMACTKLNQSVMETNYDGKGVIDLDGQWISIASLIVKADGFLGLNPVTIESGALRSEAEFYKNIFDRLNNNVQPLIPEQPCDIPVW